MRQTIFAVVVLSVAGIRRWTSPNVLEDLTGELINGGHNKLVSSIQSLLQNRNVASWSSEESGALAAAIESLSDDVVATLTSENEAAQTKITEKINVFQNAITHRKSAEADARDAEEALALAVKAEQGKATDYWDLRSDLQSDMGAAYEPCKQQEDLTDFDHALDPETSFVCDFSSTNEDGCTQKFSTFKSNMEGMVTGLNTSLNAQRSSYNAAVTQCSGAINTAEGTMQQVIAAYDSWVGERGKVSQKHNSRQSKVCLSTCDGLSGAIAAECSARAEALSLNTRTYSGNNTDSLLDRNYELKSLEVVHCLLKKLEAFRDDQFDGESVNEIVLECQNQQAWDEYALKWVTSDGFAGDCDTSSTTGDDLPTLVGSTLCDDTTLSLAFETVNTKTNGGASTQESMYIPAMIPYDLNGAVVTPENFARVPLPLLATGSAPSLCADWCPEGVANCLQNTLRTLTCTGNDEADNLDDISKVQVTDASVPEANAYLTSTTSDRPFTTSGAVESC